MLQTVLSNLRFTHASREEAPMEISFGMPLALGKSGVMTLVIGLYPEPFLRLAQTSVLR